MITVDFLRKVKVFDGLDEEQLASIQGLCREKKFRHGMKIFGEGDKATCLCTVINGEVALRFDRQGRPTAKENTIASLTEGNAFGWSSLVPPYEIRLSSYCESETCEVLMVDREGLQGLFEKDPRVGYRVIANLAEVIGNRFHMLQDEVVRRQGFEVMFGW